jgi:Tfp pilus assembly protein PilF
VQARDLARTERPPVSPATVASFVGTLVGVIVLIGALLAFDVFLSRVDERESSHHAVAEYQRGVALLDANDPRRAVEHFEAALAIERENVNFALALGEAQRRAGDASKAEATLEDLLKRAENDGAVNLAMARVLAGEGRFAESKSYFHRAIYGRWGADSLARRAEARFSLIELLAAHGGGRDLLAELLPLEDVPADSAALRMRLGQWFLLAGSPARAANQFREVLRRNPEEGDAFVGMGDAALAQGNFRTARADFERGMSLLPSDTTLAPRLAFVDTLLASDPTARGLDVLDRATRSRALVDRMLIDLKSCVDRYPGAIATAATAAVADTVHRGTTPEAMADSLISLAGELWLAYAPRCPVNGGDRVVAQLGPRLSQ